jgi:hypothetical protein
MHALIADNSTLRTAITASMRTIPAEAQLQLEVPLELAVPGQLGD